MRSGDLPLGFRSHRTREVMRQNAGGHRNQACHYRYDRDDIIGRHAHSLEVGAAAHSPSLPVPAAFDRGDRLGQAARRTGIQRRCPPSATPRPPHRALFSPRTPRTRGPRTWKIPSSSNPLLRPGGSGLSKSEKPARANLLRTAALRNTPSSVHVVGQGRQDLYASTCTSPRASRRAEARVHLYLDRNLRLPRPHRIGLVTGYTQAGTQPSIEGCPPSTGPDTAVNVQLIPPRG